MRVDRKDERYKYKRTLKALYGVILCFFILIFIFLVKIAWNNGENGEFGALCVSMVLIFYAGILLGRLLNKATSKAGSAQSSSEAKSHEQWRELHSNISQSKKKISYIRHDMANHIQVIGAMYEKCQGEYPEAAIAEISTELDRLSTVKYCDNVLLDLVLEQYIKSLQGRGVNVEADIQLTGIEGVESEQICLVFSLLIDNASINLTRGQTISIKIHKHASIKDGIIIVWTIDVKNISAKGADTSNVDMQLLRFLIKRMNGSIIIENADNGIVETGMLEVKLKDVG